MIYTRLEPIQNVANGLALPQRDFDWWQTFERIRAHLRDEHGVDVEVRYRRSDRIFEELKTLTREACLEATQA